MRQTNKQNVSTIRADHLTIIQAPEKEFYLVFGQSRSPVSAKEVPEVAEVARIAVPMEAMREFFEHIYEVVEQDFPTSDWLTLSEQSLDFWDNDKDAAYDSL